MEKYMDTNFSARERAKGLLSEMSVEEKSGRCASACLWGWSRGRVRSSALMVLGKWVLFRKSCSLPQSVLLK